MLRVVQEPRRNGQMIAETHRRIAQLVEMNRALVHDLDLSRKATAQLARERDALRQQVETYRVQIARREAVDRDENEVLGRRLMETERELSEIRDQLEILQREQAAAGDQAEEDLALALRTLEQLKRERDDLKQQLDESLASLEQIHFSLLDLAGESEC